MDGCRRQMRAATQPDQVIRDEAVEDPAEIPLQRFVGWMAQAEDGVRGDYPGRQYRRDQRPAVRRGGDLAVCETRRIDPGSAGEQALGGTAIDELSGVLHSRGKWIQVLP